MTTQRRNNACTQHRCLPVRTAPSQDSPPAAPAPTAAHPQSDAAGHQSSSDQCSCRRASGSAPSRGLQADGRGQCRRGFWPGIAWHRQLLRRDHRHQPLERLVLASRPQPQCISPQLRVQSNRSSRRLRPQQRSILSIDRQLQDLPQLRNRQFAQPLKSLSKPHIVVRRSHDQVTPRRKIARNIIARWAARYRISLDPRGQPGLRLMRSAPS